MSETQRDDSREAWEILAPELPPGWEVGELRLSAPGNSVGPCRVTGPGVKLGLSMGRNLVVASREEAVAFVWKCWGITRKQWAELNAIGLVREAAEKKIGAENVWIDTEHHLDGETKIWAWSYSPDARVCYGHASDICTAALACIKALGGGE